MDPTYQLSSIREPTRVPQSVPQTSPTNEISTKSKVVLIAISILFGSGIGLALGYTVLGLSAIAVGIVTAAIVGGIGYCIIKKYNRSPKIVTIEQAATQSLAPKRTEKSQKLELSNPIEVTSEVAFLFKEMRYNDIRSVSKYKPMGYYEGVHSPDTEEFRTRPNYLHDYRNPAVMQEIKKRKEEISQKYVKEHNEEVEMCLKTGMQCYKNKGRVYDEDALYELLKNNESTVVSELNALQKEARNIERSLELIKTITTTLRQNDKSKCTQAFVELSSRHNVPGNLIHVAYGNDIRDTSIKYEPLGQMHRLQNEFPDHYWLSIRNLIIYFQQAGAENPEIEVQNVLKQIPQEKNKMYFVINNKLHKTGSEAFPLF